MKTSILNLIPALAAAVLLSGCAHHGYGTGDEINFVAPNTAMLTDLTRTTAGMVQKLCASAAFQAKYDEVKGRLGGGTLPAIQIGNFENLVSATSAHENVRQYTPKLETCRAKAREALQNSGLFRLVGDTGAYGSDAATLNEGIARDVDEGLVDSKNLQNAGAYTAADFRMLGNLKRMADGTKHYFVLEIRLYDLQTREFWTSTEIMEKF